MPSQVMPPLQFALPSKQSAGIGGVRKRPFLPSCLLMVRMVRASSHCAVWLMVSFWGQTAKEAQKVLASSLCLVLFKAYKLAMLCSKESLSQLLLNPVSSFCSLSWSSLWLSFIPPYVCVSIPPPFPLPSPYHPLHWWGSPAGLVSLLSLPFCHWSCPLFCSEDGLFSQSNTKV